MDTLNAATIHNITVDVTEGGLVLSLDLMVWDGKLLRYNEWGCEHVVSDKVRKLMRAFECTMPKLKGLPCVASIDNEVLWGLTCPRTGASITMGSGILLDITETLGRVSEATA